MFGSHGERREMRSNPDDQLVDKLIGTGGDIGKLKVTDDAATGYFKAEGEYAGHTVLVEVEKDVYESSGHEHDLGVKRTVKIDGNYLDSESSKEKLAEFLLNRVRLGP